MMSHVVRCGVLLSVAKIHDWLQQCETAVTKKLSPAQVQAPDKSGKSRRHIWCEHNLSPCILIDVISKVLLPLRSASPLVVVDNLLPESRIGRRFLFLLAVMTPTYYEARMEHCPKLLHLLLTHLRLVSI